jgi:hypothetical protein
MRAWLFACALVLAGCTSETMERDQMGLWKSGEKPQDASPAPAETEEVRRGKVVTIPAGVVQQHAEFVNRSSTIFADAVEVDLSRNGWLALASFAVARDAVIRRDIEDRDRGVLTISLERVPEVAATKESIPTVRFGDGMRIAGVDRVVLRFWTQQSADRPQWFHASAAGHAERSAVFAVESEPPQELRGRRVDVRAEIRKMGPSYEFVSSTESQP